VTSSRARPLDEEPSAEEGWLAEIDIRRASIESKLDRPGLHTEAWRQLSGSARDSLLVLLAEIDLALQWPEPSRTTRGKLLRPLLQRTKRLKSLLRDVTASLRALHGFLEQTGLGGTVNDGAAVQADLEKYRAMRPADIKELEEAAAIDAWWRGNSGARAAKKRALARLQEWARTHKFSRRSADPFIAAVGNCVWQWGHDVSMKGPTKGSEAIRSARRRQR
jgi:hypothetical protein